MVVKKLCTWVVVVMAAMWATGAGAQSRVDDSGQLERLQLGMGWVSAKTDVRVPVKGWGRSALLSQRQNVKTTSTGEGRTWTAELGQSGGAAVRIEQRVSQSEGKTVFEITAAGVRDGEIEGIIFNVSVPAGDFAGGKLKVAEQVFALPKVRGENNDVWGGNTAAFGFEDGRGKSAVRVELEPGVQVNVQDGRRWGDEFNAMVWVHRGNLPAGQSVKLRVTLWAEGEVDGSPAHVKIDPGQVRYRLNGIGGNYCFGIESPVTRYTLDHLQVAAARTEMSLRAWAPKPVEIDPSGKDWTVFSAADQPNSRLRRELELMQELTRKRIPFTTSIWRMPAWLTEPVSPDRGGSEKRRIGEQQWPQVLQAIGTYLLYAKEKYQAEPDYFSFNEADIGIDILFTAEEHRDAIKRMGAHFAMLGLKTKCLVGDTGNARGTHQYALPTVEDPEALKYVGAVSFHSWRGASPAQYEAWAELAERLKLPLICNEAGPDPFAYQGARYRSFAYAMQEMVHYQELLMHARPQAIVYWEFTSDYSLMASDRSQQGQLAITERFCLQKHWCDLTPAGSEALGVTNDQDAVLATAFRLGEASDYTLHLANPKWEREVTIEGLPRTVQALRVVRTAKGQFYKALETVPVKDGRVKLVLPTESLTTLTTLEVKPLD